MPYDLVKTLHILSATLILGTGLGTAFYLWRADRSRDLAAIAVTARNVVLADWLFTAPALVFQVASGLWLIRAGGYGYDEAWLVITYGLFVLTVLCWLPVVWLQIRLRDLSARSTAEGLALPNLYHRYLTVWIGLGFPAFFAVVAIFYLMVAKPQA